MMQLHDICHAYGRQRVLHHVSASLPPARYTALIGPNGSGKSTLLNILSGFVHPTHGSVTLDGRDLFAIAYRERAMLLAMIQQREHIVMPYTCLEVVLMGLSPHLARLVQPSEQDWAFVRQIMALTDTASLMDKPVTQISGGEFQRVLIARALAQRPRLLFLDEAMSDLDIRSRLVFLQLLKDLTRKTGLTVLAAHHDLHTAYGVCDEAWVLDQGVLRAQGPPQEVLTPALFADIFGVEAEVVPGKGLFFRGAMDK